MSRGLTRHRTATRFKQRGIPVHFPAGARVFDPDHPARRIFRLNSGRVRLLSGGEAILGELTRGDFFGEECFLLPRRSEWTAAAVSPLVVTAYRKSELVRLLRHDPLFAQRLLKNLALRLDRYEQALRDFVTESAERRLARLLGRFLPARLAAGWVRLPLTASNAELAKMVGTTRWSVSRFLNQFQKLGWLKRQAQRVWVQPEGLNHFLRPPARSPTPPGGPGTSSNASAEP